MFSVLVFADFFGGVFLCGWWWYVPRGTYVGSRAVAMSVLGALWRWYLLALIYDCERLIQSRPLVRFWDGSDLGKIAVEEQRRCMLFRSGVFCRRGGVLGVCEAG